MDSDTQTKAVLEEYWRSVTPDHGQPDPSVFRPPSTTEPPSDAGPAMHVGGIRMVSR
jgi:hypothetical protein